MKNTQELISLLPNQEEKVEDIKRRLLNNKKLLDYCDKQGIVLSEELIHNSLMNLLQFVDQDEKCKNCQGLSTCAQINPGYKPLLKKARNYIHISYSACDYQKMHDEQLKIQDCMQSFYMPKKILSASINNIDLSKGRSQAIQKILKFTKTYTPDKFQKGTYLSGAFGIGKTYLLAAMANELAKRHIPVALVYLPDMIRELKNAIGKSNLENLVTKIKTVQVLILDDIGSEMNTQWMRDEILGPILQYRMLEELPTFFSSNKTMDQLIKDYQTTSDRVNDEVKAERIGDRIRTLADEYNISGKNYRY